MESVPNSVFRNFWQISDNFAGLRTIAADLQRGLDEELCLVRDAQQPRNIAQLPVQIMVEKRPATADLHDQLVPAAYVAQGGAVERNFVQRLVIKPTPALIWRQIPKTRIGGGLLHPIVDLQFPVLEHEQRQVRYGVHHVQMRVDKELLNKFQSKLQALI